MNWDSICYVLTNFGIKKTVRKDFQAAYTIMLMDKDVLDDPNTLYICLEGHTARRLHKALVISIGTSKATADNLIEVEKGSPASIFNALMQAERYLDTLNTLLNDAGSNQEIIDIASSYLGNPFFYFDEGYRILAITKDVKFDDDPEWEHMTTQRFLSPESVQYMQESGDLDMLAKYEEPVVYDSGYFPFTSIVSNIKYQGAPCGRLNRLCTSGKPNPVMLEECMIVVRNLSRMFSMRSVLTDSEPISNMLTDLLNGTQLAESLVRQRMQHRYGFEEGRMQIAVIDVNAGSDVHVPSYYSELVSRIFAEDQAVNLIHEDKLVLIFSACSGKNETKETSLLKKLDLFLARQNLRAGISEPFSYFNETKAHYAQAYAALGYAEPKEAVDFLSILTDHLLSFLPDRERDVFVSYEIEQLEEEQPHYSFPLVETLRVYLEEGCSLQKAADRLYIHKNTMLYRLNKIRDIISTDISDPGVQLRLLLCLKLR